MEEIRDIDAKEAFDDLLNRVERGEEIVITRDGQPVARLIRESRSAQRFDHEAARAAMARIVARRQQMSLGGLALRDLIDEGRKY